MVAASKLPVNTNASAMQMADTIFGDGVMVIDASYTGAQNSSGIYSNGNSVSPGVVPGDTGVIFSTGNASDFTNSASSLPWWLGGGSQQANQDDNTTTNTSGPNNVAGFNAIAGGNTYDASYIDVDFIPDGDTLTMQFVFASEEYPEYTMSQFQDVVGVWINGSHVPLSVAGGATTPSAVNPDTHANLFRDNTGSDYNTEMDGFTVTLALTIPVRAGELNSIRIGIADTGDSSYDSNLLIAGNSMQTKFLANDDADDIFIGQTKVIDVLANDTSPAGSLKVTHVNGVSVTAGATVTLPTGQTVTLNADGTLTVVNDLDVEEVTFTYGVGPAAGGPALDTGFVTLNSIPCFVGGTRVMTAQGERAVETLAPGDMVLTMDDGPQPLRWIGRRRVEAEGRFAPIRIAAGALSPGHGALMLSPQHRVLLTDHRADLLFGDAEVLVAAKDLVNDSTIRPAPGGQVEYIHLLFDRHQVIWAEGLPTESFLPGPQALDQFEQAVLDELFALFPELDPETGLGYAPAARPLLRGYEAQVLLADPRAA